jgi:hypothetical protein
LISKCFSIVPTFKFNRWSPRKPAYFEFISHFACQITPSSNHFLIGSPLRTFARLDFWKLVNELLHKFGKTLNLSQNYNDEDTEDAREYDQKTKSWFATKPSRRSNQSENPVVLENLDQDFVAL